MATTTTLPVPRYRSVSAGADLDTFFSLVQAMFAADDQASGRAAADRFIITEDYPKERPSSADQPLHIVTWGVEHGEVAALGSKLEGKKRYGAAPAPMSRNSEATGYVNQGWMWPEHYITRFSVWAKSNKDANADALRFHRTILRYEQMTKVLHGNGVLDFRFHHRDPDRFDNTSTDQPLYVRDLFYEFRVCPVDSLQSKTLDTVDVETADRAIDLTLSAT